jgi:hypothetical protein
VDDQTIGFYAADSDPGRPVLVAAATHLILNPGSQLDAGLRAIQVGTVVRVDPGFLGGTTECGHTRDGLLVCAWADHGSIGLVAGYGRDVDDTAALMREVRAEILHRY